MTNNSILQSIRYTFGYDDDGLMEIFKLANYDVDPSQISKWLKREEDECYENLEDGALAHFLNGFIVQMRGARDQGLPAAESKLNNNIIFRKLKIALELKNDDVLKVMNAVKYQVSKHEISAFLRREGHKHYRSCQDQFLRYFLRGLKLLAN